MTKEYTIDRVSWHTNQKGSLEAPDEIVKRFEAFAEFLQSNGLTTMPLLGNDETVGDDFAIRSTDLTELGLAVTKRAYNRWLTHIDRGGDPQDTRILEKALAVCTGEKT